VSSNVSHDLFKFCFDGGYKYDCSPNGASYRKGHKGTDFASPLGTTIYAGAGGIVSAVREHMFADCIMHSNGPAETVNSGQGNFVNVKHSNRRYAVNAHVEGTAVQTASVTYKSVLGYVAARRLHGVFMCISKIDYGTVPYDPFSRKMRAARHKLCGPRQAARR